MSKRAYASQRTRRIARSPGSLASGRLFTSQRTLAQDDNRSRQPCIRMMRFERLKFCDGRSGDAKLAPWLRVSFTVLDILLVALIIYEVLVMIRGTRAAPMLAGLAAVAAAFYLARIGELVTLNWLVSHLLPYVVFALIVVFQSEIRHVLSDVGRRVSFLRGSAVEGDSYDDIVLAANLFSQHQTGALMVIEREIGLRTYIESGVSLDARLSYDLLATIFRPSAPLHDGAVIIQKDRLAAAACFLPLSMNPVLSTQMEHGTGPASE